LNFDTKPSYHPHLTSPIKGEEWHYAYAIYLNLTHMGQPPTPFGKGDFVKAKIEFVGYEEFNKVKLGGRHD
jgi:hypothetical protein